MSRRWFELPLSHPLFTGMIRSSTSIFLDFVRRSEDWKIDVDLTDRGWNWLKTNDCSAPCRIQGPSVVFVSYDLVCSWTLHGLLETDLSNHSRKRMYSGQNSLRVLGCLSQLLFTSLSLYISFVLLFYLEVVDSLHVYTLNRLSLKVYYQYCY